MIFLRMNFFKSINFSLSEGITRRKVGVLSQCPFVTIGQIITRFEQWLMKKAAGIIQTDCYDSEQRIGIDYLIPFAL